MILSVALQLTTGAFRGHIALVGGLVARNESISEL